MPEVEPTRPIEKAREVCGLMVVMEGGISTTVNLFEEKADVIKSIQGHLMAGDVGLLSFNAANPDEQETFLLDPRKIIIAMVKREFTIKSGKILPVSGLIEKGNAGTGRGRLR